MHEDNHGHSLAAWVGVTIMIVGAIVACWGVYLRPDFLLWVGVAVGVVGALTWYMMDRMGIGEKEREHSER